MNIFEFWIVTSARIAFGSYYNVRNDTFFWYLFCFLKFCWRKKSAIKIRRKWSHTSVKHNLRRTLSELNFLIEGCSNGDKETVSEWEKLLWASSCLSPPPSSKKWCSKESTVCVITSDHFTIVTFRGVYYSTIYWNPLLRMWLGSVVRSVSSHSQSLNWWLENKLLLYCCTDPRAGQKIDLKSKFE